MTVVEWLFDKMFDPSWDVEHQKEWLKKAKEMERNQAHEYAEFAIRCDRKEMKILNFEDWIKL